MNEPVNFLVQTLRLVRPRQWVKNLFVFAPLVFSGNLFDAGALATSIGVFLAFSLASGGVYALNDVVDREADRAHPMKRGRPVASGAISPFFAVLVAVLIGAAGGLLAWRSGALYTVAGYMILQLAYSLAVKHLVILDVLAIAMGFVLRVLGGGEALDVYVSPWLILCTFLLSLFLATTKRRQEAVLVADGTKGGRPVLDDYSLDFLDQMISVETPAVVLGYAIYTVSPDTVEKFGTTALVWTVPFVVYGIFRYLYLIYKCGEAEDAAMVLFRDKGLLLAVVLWFSLCAFIIYGW